MLTYVDDRQVRYSNISSAASLSRLNILGEETGADWPNSPDDAMTPGSSLAPHPSRLQLPHQQLLELELACFVCIQSHTNLPAR